MVWAVPKQSSAKRGYGAAHTKARAQAAKLHRDTDPCCRCGHPLGPMSAGLHYDHNNARDGYLGFSHGHPCPWCGRKCNIEAGARKGARVRNRRARVRKIITNADRW